MIYRTIEAKTKSEAIASAKKQFGPELMINDVKYIGFFHKKCKVTVAIEDSKYAHYISVKNAQLAINKSVKNTLFINSGLPDSSL